MKSSIFFRVIQLSCAFVIFDIVSNGNIENSVTFSNVARRETKETHAEGKYNILVFGGSVTWGAGLPNPNRSYASLLSKMTEVRKVRNLALRATGSEYPRYCLESMIGTDDDTLYDIILLEFSVNGMAQLENLVQRVRLRYPDSTIIYVDLYSLRSEVTDENGVSIHQRGLFRRYSEEFLTKWTWGGEYGYHNAHLLSLKNNLKTRSLVIEFVELPRNDPPMVNVDLFNDDMHHLSKDGHSVIADLISNKLKDIEDVTIGSLSEDAGTSPKLGTWGRGDKCISWYSTGKIMDTDFKSPNSLHKFEPYKYAIEFTQEDPGMITIFNPKQYPMKLHLSFMVKQSNYPPTKIVFEDDTTMNLLTVSKTPFHKQNMEMIGVACPGENILKVIPGKGAPLPFRLTGVILEGAVLKLPPGKVC